MHGNLDNRFVDRGEKSITMETQVDISDISPVLLKQGAEAVSICVVVAIFCLLGEQSFYADFLRSILFSEGF